MTRKQTFQWLWIIAILMFGARLSCAELSLGKVFTDNAVLQAGKPIVIWGKCKAGNNIEITLGKSQKKVVSDSSGNWQATFDPLPSSSKSLQLEVSDGVRSIITRNLLIGEVWLASGQSNMQWPLKQSHEGINAIKSSSDQYLRVLQYNGRLHPGGRKYPREFLTQLHADNYYQSSGWQASDPETSPEYSAVAYHFAKELRKKLDVPIGIISLPVGGSPIEAHLPEKAFASDPVLKPLMENWLNNPEYPQWCRQRAALNLTHWLNEPEPRKHPPHPFAPAFLWRAGIQPLSRFPIRGIIWYQGESNATQDGAHGDAVPQEINARKLRALVGSFRKHWRDDKLPFYHVQLPGLNRKWAPFREMQQEVTDTLPGVGMAVTLDLGHPTDVHPRKKKPVGERLSRLALHSTYGKSVRHQGPRPDRITVDDIHVTIHYKHANHLRTTDSKTPRTFELAGQDGVFYPANATISGASVILNHPKVQKPLSVRYAWADNPNVNLVNGDGLPAHPFRQTLKP